jgi:hypothetical protein
MGMHFHSVYRDFRSSCVTASYLLELFRCLEYGLRRVVPSLCQLRHLLRFLVAVLGSSYSTTFYNFTKSNFMFNNLLSPSKILNIYQFGGLLLYECFSPFWLEYLSVLGAVLRECHDRRFTS